MSGWARPGVKCVCVDNTDHPEIIVGRAYTIKSVYYVNWPSEGKYKGEGLCVELEEAKNWSLFPAFAIERFRPLITRTQQQDLEQFIPLLTRELVDAK